MPFTGFRLSSMWPPLAVLCGAFVLLIEEPRLQRARIACDARVARVTGWAFLAAGVITWFLTRKG